MQVLTWLSSKVFHLRPIWLQTLVLVDSNSCQRSLTSFWTQKYEVPRRLCCSEHTPFSKKWNRFETCVFDSFHPIPYFPIETNAWSKDWAKQLECARLWLVKSSHKIHRKFHLYHQIIWRKNYLIRHVSKFTRVKTFSNLEISHKNVSTFPSSEPVAARSDCRRLGNAQCLRPSDPPNLCRSAP